MRDEERGSETRPAQAGTLPVATVLFDLDQTLTTRGACPGWLAHPWVKAMDTAPGHRASARCAQAASVGWSWRL